MIFVGLIFLSCFFFEENGPKVARSGFFVFLLRHVNLSANDKIVGVWVWVCQLMESKPPTPNPPIND